MKRVSSLLAGSLILLFGYSCGNVNNGEASMDSRIDDASVLMADTVDATNNFYDNAQTYLLKTNDVQVAGEIKNPGKVDFSQLPLHSVIVKETILDGDGDAFVGAFRYDGYSLYDILNLRGLDKKNEGKFKPIIDLFLEIENEAGEKVVVSWGEVFYPNHLHEIIIATQVMRIVPSKTNELWTLPVDNKLIVSSDLLTERNISNPSKITVKSYPIEFLVEKGKTPLFSPKVDVYIENQKIETLKRNPSDKPQETLHSIFYGRGRGIHSTKPFTGVTLKEVFKEEVKRTKLALQQGIFVIAADDGYRVVYTYSEVCNRNDQAEVLLICDPTLKNNGIFRVFPSCDFFSDRAIKGMTAIYYSEKQQ